jgi:hypothetical protein
MVFERPQTEGVSDGSRLLREPFFHRLTKQPAQRFFLFPETIWYQLTETDENPDCRNNDQPTPTRVFRRGLVIHTTSFYRTGSDLSVEC